MLREEGRGKREEDLVGQAVEREEGRGKREEGRGSGVTDRRAKCKACGQPSPGLSELVARCTSSFSVAASLMSFPNTNIIYHVPTNKRKIPTTTK